MASRVATLRDRFGLSRVAVVGDRCMLTGAGIREGLAPAGLDWTGALRGDAIRALVKNGDIQPSLFGERDLAETGSGAFPGERLVVCRNPPLAEERARKREAPPGRTEEALAAGSAASGVGPGPACPRAGRVTGKWKMGRHFEWSVSGDGGFSYSRREDRIAAEAALDGLYVVRTSLPEAELDGPGTVRACRRLSRVERAFRSLKTVNMKVRPVYRCAEDRVRAHVLICMLAQCVEFEMRRRLAPVLFDDGDWEGAEAGRASVVAPAEVSESAKSRASSKLTADGLPAQGFRSLLGCLSGIVRNTVTPNIPDAEPFPTVTEANAIQRRAPDPLGVRLRRSRQGFLEIQLYEVRSEGYGSTHSEAKLEVSKCGFRNLACQISLDLGAQTRVV